jgi:myo-inositol-1(or 4)-monophosphatase
MKEMRTLLSEVRIAVTAMLPDIMARRSDVRWKPDGSPVTAADLFVEEQLSDFLRLRLPGLVVQGEESWVTGQPPAERWVAVLDPIDGTENFCSGLKEWGVSLSLWKGCVHASSMLLLPELDACLMTGDQPERLRSRIVGLSSTVSDETLAVLETLHEARITGCAVYNLYNVARGAFARFVNPKGAFSWDLLAGVQLAREHGCSVQLDGLPYDGRFLEPGLRYRIDIQHRYDLHPR